MELALTIADRNIRMDPERRYCLNDVHRAAGNGARHQPANWLRLETTQVLAAAIATSSDVRNPPIKTRKGVGTYVCKELVYAFGMWISPAFNLAVIRAFDAMQSRGLAQMGVQAALNNPATLRALLAENIDERLRLEHAAAVTAPRVAAYDRLTDQRGAISLTAAAKTLGISPNQFFRWLSLEEWIYRSADFGSWLAKQRQIDAGYLIHRLNPTEHSPGYERLHPQVLVTARGVARLALLLEQASFGGDLDLDDAMTTREQGGRR